MPQFRRKPAEHCPVELEEGIYDNAYSGGSPYGEIPFTRISCEESGSVYVLQRKEGEWLAVASHPFNFSLCHYCGPPGPEFAEKMAKAWQAAADLIRQKLAAEEMAAFFAAEEAKPLSPTNPQEPPVTSSEPSTPVRTFVVEVVHPNNVGGYWIQRGKPNLWANLDSGLFPADVAIDQEYRLEAVRVLR